jgi:hypothetical protein
LRPGRVEELSFERQKRNKKNKDFYFGKEKRFSTFADPKRGKPGSEFRGIKIQKDLLTAMVSEYKAEPRGEASKFFKEKIIM